MSFFSRDEAIALHRSGFTMCGSKPCPLEQLQQPPPAERGLVRRRGTGRQAPDHRQDRLNAVGTFRLARTLPPNRSPPVGCQKCAWSVWPAVFWTSRGPANPAYSASSDRQAA